MRIYKQALELRDVQVIRVPKGAKLLTVQVQRELPCLWYLCDETAEASELRAISIYGTGHTMPDAPGEYIATFQMHGSLVFHAFEAT